MRFAVLALVLALSGTAAPAQPQGRTIEGAQRFLSHMLKNRMYRWGMLHSVAARTGMLVRGHSFITDASAIKKCESQFRIDNSRVQISTFTGVRRDFHDLAPGQKVLADPIDWGSDVSHIRQTERYVHLRFTGGPHESRIDMQDAALARRVSAAIIFLREHCDPTADTEF
jgi:hypothetical protein